MNWAHFQERWLQIRGRLMSSLGKLIADDIKHISGRKAQQLLGGLRKRYGILRHEAERQVEEWLEKLPPPRKR